MAPHEGEVGAQVGEALGLAARHLGEQRALAVHHLVVAQRQHAVPREGIVQAEGHLVMVDAAVHRVAAHVVEGVVNPPRSEEKTSELQSLMRSSYAVFCLKKTNK